MTATIAVFIALGGSSYAITSGSIGSKQIRNNSVRSADIRNNTILGRDIHEDTIAGRDVNESSLAKVPSAQSADSATNAANAGNSANLGGSPAASYQRFGDTLPSGRSESGDFGIRTPNPSPGTTSFLDQSVSFAIPLAVRIPQSKVIYATTLSGVSHCSGPGHADPGYLCIYEVNSAGVAGPAEVSAFENQAPQAESGNFAATWSGA